MSRLAIRPEAIADPGGIEEHIALDNPDQALAFVERLFEAMRLLASQPLMGRARPERGAEIRSFPVRGHVVFSEPLANGIDVVRILSGARDVDSVL